MGDAEGAAFKWLCVSQLRPWISNDPTLPSLAGTCLMVSHGPSIPCVPAIRKSFVLRILPPLRALPP